MADHVLTDVSVFDLNLNVVTSGYSTINYVSEVTPVEWVLSSAKTFDIVSEEGGGGSTRPTSGFLYPRGQG